MWKAPYLKSSGMEWKQDLTPRILVPKHAVRDLIREMTLQSEEDCKAPDTAGDDATGAAGSS